MWRTNPDRANEVRVAARDPESRARTHLANERTFLAWLRTGLSLIALGLAADQFLADHPVRYLPLTSSISALLVIGGVLLTLAGMGQFLRGRDRIEAGTYSPDVRAIIFSTILAVAFGILAIGFVASGCRQGNSPGHCDRVARLFAEWNLVPATITGGRLAYAPVVPGGSLW
jgi:putative membrane protein